MRLKVRDFKTGKIVLDVALADVEILLNNGMSPEEIADLLEGTWEFDPEKEIWNE